MWTQEYKDCLEYIDNYWNRIVYKPSKMRLRFKIRNIPHLLYEFNGRMGKTDLSSSFIKLPHYYFTPNDSKFTHIFYWDSFFMFRGLMGTKREWLMKEMVENFAYLFKTFQIIPNFSAPASMGRSQPPFFSSMILEAYLSRLNTTNPYSMRGLRKYLYTLFRKQWLKHMMQTAKEEYEKVWIDEGNAYNHHVKGYFLSRYGDRDIGYAHSSELESGWDMTSRFYNRCDQYLPIDLNSYLYKYETDFAFVAGLFGDEKEKNHWLYRANKRREEMTEYLWDRDEGFFYDYNYVSKQIGHYFSLASYTPLWTGLATPYQAGRMLKKLSKFETPYGLTIGAEVSLPKPIDYTNIQQRFRPAIQEVIKPKQWDYPNIWSPLEYLTVIGLLKYGYVEEAKRIMTNSVKAHARLYRKYKTFFEKIKGTDGEPASSFHYTGQNGFGWTNAVFFRYIQLLTALDTMPHIFKEDPTKKEPPYELAVLH